MEILLEVLLEVSVGLILPVQIQWYSVPIVEVLVNIETGDMNKSNDVEEIDAIVISQNQPITKK